jgi:3-oxoacyl-[acyl-carrier protein] reductase
MKENGSGNIVNISVGSGHGGGNKFDYGVSKGGVNSLTTSAAVDLAFLNIRVNAISIGSTGTPVGSKENPERKRKYESNTLVGHIGLPSDIANAVSF